MEWLKPETLRWLLLDALALYFLGVPLLASVALVWLFLEVRLGPAGGTRARSRWRSAFPRPVKRSGGVS